MWFRKYLVPYKHFVPIQHDLSDLVEKIEWCRSHDSECEQIAKNAKVFYDTYLGKRGILDFLQTLLVNMKQVCGQYFYSTVSPDMAMLQYEEKQLQMLYQTAPYQATHVFEKPYSHCNWGLLRAMQWTLLSLDSQKRLPALALQRTLYSGRNVSVSEIDVFGMNIFVAKKLTNPSKKAEFIHDAFVGTQMNPLVKEIPNFLFTVGLVDDQKVLIRQAACSTVPFQTWIRNSFSINQYVSLLIQITLAIDVAQQRHGLVHNDMMPWNILIAANAAEPVEYRHSQDVMRFHSSLRAYITDFGKSHVVGADRIHYGGLDMPPFFDIIVLVLGSLNEVVARRLSKEELTVIFTLARYFMPADARTSQMTLKDVKDWLRTARKYNNILELRNSELAYRQPLQFVDFLVKTLPFEGHIERTKQCRHRPWIGNERMVYDIMMKGRDIAKAEARRVVFPKAHSRIQQAYLRILWESFAGDARYILGLEVKREKEPKLPCKPLRLNRYKFPDRPLRTPYNAFTFSNPTELKRVVKWMEHYIVLDYIAEKEILDYVFTTPNALAPDEITFYTTEMGSLTTMNTFATLHELADKETCKLLVNLCTKVDHDKGFPGYEALFFKTE